MKQWCRLTLLIVASMASGVEARKPNFLLIVVDDQSPFDLRIYNPKSELDTPNIDRLAAEGMVFDAAHHMGSWSGAVCTPSRHMIMSGRTVWHLPQQKQHCPPDLPEQTMAAMFNRAGYDTMRGSRAKRACEFRSSFYCEGGRARPVRYSL